MDAYLPKKKKGSGALFLPPPSAYRIMKGRRKRKEGRRGQVRDTHKRAGGECAARACFPGKISLSPPFFSPFFDGRLGTRVRPSPSFPALSCRGIFGAGGRGPTFLSSLSLLLLPQSGKGENLVIYGGFKLSSSSFLSTSPLPPPFSSNIDPYNGQ